MKIKYTEMDIDTSTPVLDELGLAIDTQVKFRRRDGGDWLQGKVKGDYKDGSISIVDRDGRWCSIMPEKVMKATKGPRGGRSWSPVLKPEEPAKQRPQLTKNN